MQENRRKRKHSVGRREDFALKSTGGRIELKLKGRRESMKRTEIPIQTKKTKEEGVFATLLT